MTPSTSPFPILPAAPLPPGASISLDPANTVADLVWLQEVAQAFAYSRNQQLAREYLTYAFTNWNTTYQAGRTDESTLPQPPLSFMVQMTGGGWSYELLPIGPPVCSVPSYPKAVPAQSTLPGNHVHVGKRTWGDYFAIGIDDTAPQGTSYVGVSDDGVGGTFVRIGGPLAHIGWYLKTA